MTVVKQKKNDNKVITNTQILPGSRNDNFITKRTGSDQIGPPWPYLQTRVSFGQKVF